MNIGTTRQPRGKRMDAIMLFNYSHGLVADPLGDDASIVAVAGDLGVSLRIALPVYHDESMQADILATGALPSEL